MDLRNLGEQGPKRLLVPVDHEPLKGGQPQDQTLQRAEVYALQPADDRRIAAGVRIDFPFAMQFPPVHPRMSMMLNMIPVVEKQEIVEPAIMTYCPSRMLVTSLQMAQPKTGKIARQVNCQGKVGGEDEHRPP